MSQELSPHAANLLKAEYHPYVSAKPVVMAAPAVIVHPSADLVHQLQGDAEDFGIPMSAVADWSVWVTSVLAAITSQNYLALIPLVLQLGSYIPQGWAFLQQIIKLFHGNQAPSTGPSISGS